MKPLLLFYFLNIFLKKKYTFSLLNFLKICFSSLNFKIEQTICCSSWVWWPVTGSCCLGAAAHASTSTELVIARWAHYFCHVARVRVPLIFTIIVCVVTKCRQRLLVGGLPPRVQILGAALYSGFILGFSDAMH